MTVRVMWWSKERYGFIKDTDTELELIEDPPSCRCGGLQANLRLSEMEGFRRGGILALPLLFVSSSGLSLPSIPPNLNDHPLSLKLALLRPKTAGGPFVEPSLADMTTALASISNAGLHPESWTTALENGSP